MRFGYLIKKMKLSRAFYNPAYLVPSAKLGQRRYFGIGVNFPQLSAGKYTITLFEEWKLGKAVIPHTVEIPIAIDKNVPVGQYKIANDNQLGKMRYDHYGFCDSMHYSIDTRLRSLLGMTSRLVHIEEDEKSWDCLGEDSFIVPYLSSPIFLDGLNGADFRSRYVGLMIPISKQDFFAGRKKVVDQISSGKDHSDEIDQVLRSATQLSPKDFEDDFSRMFSASFLGLKSNTTLDPEGREFLGAQIKDFMNGDEDLVLFERTPEWIIK